MAGAAGWWLIEGTTRNLGGATSRARRAIPMSRIDVEERESRVVMGWTYDARNALAWVDDGVLGPLCVYHHIPAEG